LFNSSDFANVCWRCYSLNGLYFLLLVYTGCAFVLKKQKKRTFLAGVCRLLFSFKRFKKKQRTKKLHRCCCLSEVSVQQLIFSWCLWRCCLLDCWSQCCCCLQAALFSWKKFQKEIIKKPYFPLIVIASIERSQTLSFSDKAAICLAACASCRLQAMSS